MGILERKGRRSFFPKYCRFFCEKSSVLKKRGNSRGGEALGVAKPVSPPHTPPLRARRCATPWSVLIYRLSPVCCCIGGVRLSRFFCSTGRESGPRSGPVPWDMAKKKSFAFRDRIVRKRFISPNRTAKNRFVPRYTSNRNRSATQTAFRSPHTHRHNPHTTNTVEYRILSNTL